MRPAIRSCLVAVLAAALLVATSACSISRAHRRPVLLALAGVTIGAGAVVAGSAPSCPEGPEDQDWNQLFGEIGCNVGRSMSITFGSALIATGAVALILAAHASPGEGAPAATAGGPPVEERLLIRAREDARLGRCDRVRVLADSLSIHHRDYHARVVVTDPILRPCLWPSP